MSNNLKLLIISGPTATGKTSLALKLAKKYNGELISADSRQIYRDMNIGTGKDHPKDTVIHLIDIINPDEVFSVAQFRQLATQKIIEITHKGKLPIIVGGTGQYIDSIINPQPTFTIKPNKLLRFILNKFSLKFLQTILKLVASSTFKHLNNSDIHNPHRLIRKIEIALTPHLIDDPVLKTKKYNFLHISLTAPNDYLYKQIDLRVKKRFDNGLLKEIKYLLTKYKWSDPGLNTLAYREFNNYSDVDNSIEKWRFDEHAYARRQKTWFKKIKNIDYFDITKPNYYKNLIKKTDKWYNNL